MTDYLATPDPADILPRPLVLFEDSFMLATALVPWARQHPRFTFTCALTVSGLRTVEFANTRLVGKVRRALSHMECVRDGFTSDGISRIWRFPDNVQLVAAGELRIGRSGFTYDASEPAPQPAQVEVCRAWLREHARPTRTIRRNATTEWLSTLVTAWTRATGAFTEEEQVNEYTGERFHTDHVYVSEGAFLAAARAEGYRAQRIRETPHAWLNLSWRETGKLWRGREPKPALPTSAPARQKATPDVILRRKVTKYLGKLDEEAAAAAEAPRFQLVKLARRIGVPAGEGHARRALTTLLRELGWEPRYTLIRGHRSQWWCRVRTTASELARVRALPTPSAGPC